MAGAAEVRRTFAVADRDGLHARPCTRIARAAQRFRCDVAATCNGRSADARSVFELLGLNAAHGALVEFRATGPEAARCLDAIERAIAQDDGGAPGTP